MMLNKEDDYTNSESILEERSTSSKKLRNMNKRRFTDKQISSLETIFESDSKLESVKKLQLAKELELHPRQVAIWFQNKRARCKSKQLERDYEILETNYNNLAFEFETLKKEKHALQVQLQKLNDQMKNLWEETITGDGYYPPTASSENRDRHATMADDDSSIKAERFGLNEELRLSLSLKRSEHNISVFLDEDSSIEIEYYGFDQEPELINMVDSGNSILTTPDNWESLNTDGIINHCSSSSQWWDALS